MVCRLAPPPSLTLSAVCLGLGLPVDLLFLLGDLQTAQQILALFIGDVATPARPVQRLLQCLAAQQGVVLLCPTRSSGSGSSSRRRDSFARTQTRSKTVARCDCAPPGSVSVRPWCAAPPIPPGASLAAPVIPGRFDFVLQQAAIKLQHRAELTMIAQSTLDIGQVGFAIAAITQEGLFDDAQHALASGG